MATLEEVQKLFLKNSGEIKGFISALVPDFNQADDVFQELFLTITKKADVYEMGTGFMVWTRSIARFKIKEVRRKVTQKGFIYLSDDVLDVMIEELPEQTNWDEKQNVLNKCVEKLAPRARSIIELRYKKENKPAQIAKILKQGVDSINVTLARARKALKDCTQKVQLSEEVS